MDSEFPGSHLKLCDELKSHLFLVHFFDLFLSKKRLIYVQKYGVTNQTVIYQGIREKEEFLQKKEQKVE